MTRQEMYSKVKAAINAQGAPAWDELSGVCVYRTKDGKRCAVGALVPDEEYIPMMEGSRVQSIKPEYTPRSLASLSGEDIQFVADMQTAHDYSAEDAMGDTKDIDSDMFKSAFLTYFNQRMAQIAEFYDLKDE